MRKVLLINPYFLTKKYRYSKSTYHYYPTGLIYIASNLPKNKYEVKVLDLFINQLGYDEFIKTINEFSPDYVGISAYTENIVSAFEIADILKRINNGLKIILGGSHVSALPEEALRENGNIDFVIAGEGEKSFPMLLEYLDNDKEAVGLNGVYSRKNGKNVIGRENLFIDDLDSLLFPDWGLAGYKNYSPLIKFSGNTLELPLITQRGCPYSCTFCYDLHGKKVRQRMIDNVLEEIDSNFNKYRAKNFAILDEVFTFDRERTLRFCQEIINSRLSKHINFGCSTRADLLDSNLIEKMKEAGFNRIMLGVESGSEVTLSRMNKNISINNMRSITKCLKENGIITHISVIIGYPFETRPDIKKTISFARSLGPDYLSINILFPYPGTDIFKQASKNESVFKQICWINFSKNITVPIDLKDIGERDLKRYQFLGYLRYYSNPLRLFSLIKTFGLKKILRSIFLR